MKWQVVMVALATMVALFLGASRWSARITAGSAYSKQAADGKWLLIYGDNAGIRTLTGASSNPEPLHGFEKLPAYMTGGFDVTSDLQRMAWVDSTNYSEPSVRLVPARHVEKAIAFANAGSGHQLLCPLIDVDGSVLVLENANNGQAWELRRMSAPANERPATSPRSLAPVALPAGITADDCFERSTDGSVFAWLGTDQQIHYTTRAANGSFGADTKTAGSDFELASDGSFVATTEGGTRLVHVDTATGTRTTVTEELKSGRTVAISPDGRWILATTVSSFGGGGWTAFRVRDGAEVPLHVGGSAYFGYDTRRKIWITH